MSAIRAATWLRVSSKRQGASEREGLPYQRELVAAAIASLDAVDTGITWAPEQSGGSVHLSGDWAEMLARAGRDFDVLIVAYTSRMARNAEELLRAVRLIGEAGASVYFAEERCHTADDASWEAFSREAVEAESYRRRLSRTMKRTNESRWARRGLPVGMPPFGFDRGFAINEADAAKVRMIFSTYAEGNLSLNDIAHLADVNLKEEHVKSIVKNPAYAARATYNGRERPASFEAIVAPELWDRVAAMRASRRFATGPRPQRSSPLRGRTYCQCGARLRLDGYDGSGHHRTRHMSPLCAPWGRFARKRTDYFLEPLSIALSQMQLASDEIERIVARAASETPAMPEPLDLPRQRRQLRLDFEAGRLDATSFVAQSEQLQEQVDQQRYDLAQQPASATVSPDTLRAFLLDFRALIERLRDHPRGSEALNNIVERYVARVEYTGPHHITITPKGDAIHAITPETLPTSALVGGEGLEPPTSSV